MSPTNPMQNCFQNNPHPPTSQRGESDVSGKISLTRKTKKMDGFRFQLIYYRFISNTAIPLGNVFMRPIHTNVL